MFCAISGKSCISPVFLPQDGRIYERDLIVKYIEKNSKSPHSTEKVEIADLVKVENATVTKPTPPSFTSLPSLLVAMQQEWDAVMLESFELKQQLNQAQQELSNCLYENDAAKRVIARLLKERDEAREKLSQFSKSTNPVAQKGPSIPDTTQGQEMLLDLAQDVALVLEEKANELTEWRRKKKASESLLKPETFKSFQILSTVKTLSTAKEPTTTSLSLNENDCWVLTAGVDGTCAVVDWHSDKPICSLKTHKQAVNDITWIDQTRFLSGSDDCTVKVWNVESQKNGFKIKNVGSVCRWFILG
jgi:pre-mRNA-processing factor 19